MCNNLDKASLKKSLFRKGMKNKISKRIAICWAIWLLTKDILYTLLEKYDDIIDLPTLPNLSVFQNVPKPYLYCLILEHLVLLISSFHAKKICILSSISIWNFHS